MSLPHVALRRLESHVIRQCRASISAPVQLRHTLTRLPCSSHPRSASRGYATVSAAELEFGQPVYETHPHVLQPGEITPGITAREYANRRADLAYSLPENGVAILPAADLKYRSGAVFFPFRQESNFLYLTGFLEPGSVAVIRRTGRSHGDYIFHLFCRPKDPKAEQWSGPWSGLQAATDVFNADVSHDIASLPNVLPSLLRSATIIYADLPPSSPHTQPIRSALPSSSTPSPLRLLINPLRAIKSPAEIAVMRHAGRISGRALTSAMRRPWTLEKSLGAFLTHEFTQSGLDGPAYVPVIAGGPRGLMIHYVHNNNTLTPGSTVLVDAGGEYGNYITDITRTWPVSGRFSPAQRDLYSAVLIVQRECVSLCRANAGLSLDMIHRAAEDGLRRELKTIGFDLGSGGRALDILFPHHVGHYVGLDVHDVPGYGRSISLQKGHCVTVEPGVYVPDDERWPKHFRGLAVRIEDSVAVDEEGSVVLTAEAVKEVVDIEALREDV
ncbi:peptidase M24, structural domain-containing protein [Immersiella caudata]|uniref:Xaa-Pro aminopeptidase n=1 Tax=Immersiella caudata TaxID=314043 RepID=A0AA39WKW4_9PEZI|nr:peptidase M24, structural domain-containing protein [Immersiella caudata]